MAAFAQGNDAFEDAAAQSSSDSIDSEAQSDSFDQPPGIDVDLERNEIAGKHSAEVSRWRGMVTIMLFATAALVITTTYVFLSREETDEFEKSFFQSAGTISYAAKFFLRNGLGTVLTLGDTIASEARLVNTTWPFLTTHDFEVKAARARLDASSEFIMFAPIVHATDRSGWEGYSVNHQDWIMESREQLLQTSLWFENEFYTDGDQGMNHAGMDHGGTMDNGGTMDHSGIIDDGDIMDHSGTMSHDIGSGRRTLQEMEGGMGGADMPAMVEGMSLMDTSATATPIMGNYTPTLDMGDALSAGMTMSTGMEGMGVNHSDPRGMSSNDSNISDKIYHLESGAHVSAESQPLYAPVWQMSPPPKIASLVNFDLMSDPIFERTIEAMIAPGGQPMLSELVDLSIFYEGIFTIAEHWALHDRFHDSGGQDHNAKDHPHTIIAAPIRGMFEVGSAVDGIIAAVISWDLYLSRLLPVGVNGVNVVLDNTCGQVVSYVINGPAAVYLGEGDLHETKFDYLRQTVRVSDVLGSDSGSNLTASESCDYILIMYPSTAFRESYNSSRPEVFTVILACVFVATGAVFLVYVQYVQQRQNKIVATALRTDAIVSSLFPSNVRDRILQDAEEQVEREMKSNSRVAAKHHLQNFLEHEPKEAGNGKKVFATKPIADLFPETTIMFGDLVGFTAWSSVREPSQVFTLLETVYQAFDELAKRRGVFKVETVGDCYVAVTGLPESRKDHALVMARFAKDCNVKLMRLVKQLEVTLGPDTGDLSMRFGLHSGPVTAGVLRGERARFQLFGDTMNTTARIESTGKRGKIHISQETADLLITSGKIHWLEKRDEKVSAKGIGELQTYWLNTRTSTTKTGSVVSMSSASDTIPDTDTSDGLPELGQVDKKSSRLVNWNFKLLLGPLKQIVARRQVLCQGSSGGRYQLNAAPGAIVLDEFKEIITLPKFDEEAAKNEVDPGSIDVGKEVENELHNYISTIALMYRENPFHNFEHASHVTMSVVKLLSRIVAPSDIQVESGVFASTLHDHTYGITSDPLTQFACIFSALIHDVDHVGVPNTQLIKENAAIADLYKNKSVAEQNSVDLAWDLLMDDRYDNLRSTIYASEEELKRFRQLVVNSVMATDIMDKDLKALRNGRWDKAFNKMAQQESEEVVNRKATIVIEHLIQASDVSHTMQHWHIYRKWNERLFAELYKAYVEGRAEKDPSEFWYKGEIGFFDFYIIPLAKKLKDCGVFGVSCYEYLDYAERNRAEWESKGQEAVETMMEKVKKELFVTQKP